MELSDIVKKMRHVKPNIGSVELEPIELDVTDTLTIAGTKDAGKSYFASFLANQYPMVIFWDTRWERFTTKEKSKVSVKAFQMPDKWVVANNLEGLKTLMLRGKTHILYHPRMLKKDEYTVEDQIKEFNDACYYIFNWGDYTLFVDEADSFCDTHHMPEGFINLLEYGKHASTGTVAITRRLQHLHPRIPRLSSLLILFRLSGKDFKYVSEYVTAPEQFTKIDFFDSWKRELTQLEDRYFYIFDGKTLRKFEPVGEIK